MTGKQKIDKLKVKQLGIDTGKELIVFIHENNPVIANEGFEANDRVRINNSHEYIIAGLDIVSDENIVGADEVGLSSQAYKMLGVKDRGDVVVTRMRPVASMSYVRSKVFGHKLGEKEIEEIISDITTGRLSRVQTACFLTACTSAGMSGEEIGMLTKAMVEVGQSINWDAELVVDKHCIGGIPGNRTTLIVVPIVAAFGLKIPKTSSRAITSPSGTADTMEVLAPVTLSMKEMQKVVEKENGCIVWGGSTSLSPADDLIIRVEYELDLDSKGQLVASVMSKKIAAGSTCTVIDIPIGPTAKIRNMEDANELKKDFEAVGKYMNIGVKVIFTDGTQPIGNGIGPSLEARDVLKVLRCEANAPQDLREKCIKLAGLILEYSPEVNEGEGANIAQEILDSGKALKKFEAICKAQGGMREIPVAPYIHAVKAKKDGKVVSIDNRKLSQLAKLAGAPVAKTAGVDLHKHIGDDVEKGESLFDIHAESMGELDYALELLENNEIINVE